jgi:uncharacterized protein YerC
MKNTFDQHIKHALSDYGEDPDDQVWSGLKQELTQKKNRKRGFVFFAVFLLTGLIAGMIWLAIDLSSGKDVDREPVLSAQTLKEREISRKNIPGKSAISASPSTEETSSPGKKASLHSNISKRYTGVSSFAIDVPLTVQAIASNPEVHDVLLSEETPGILSPLGLRIFYIPPIDLPESNKTAYIQKGKAPQLLTPYFVGLTLMPAMTNRILTGDHDIVNSRNQHETRRPGLALGLNAGKRLSRHFEISSGLNLSFYTQKIVHDWEETSIANDSVKVRKRGNSEAFYHHFNDTLKQARIQAYTNRFTVVQIPVNILFRQALTLRTSIYVSTGLQLSYIARSQVNVNYNSSQGLVIEKTPTQHAYSRWNAGGNAGIGFMTRLNNNYELNIGIQSSISSNYFIKGAIKEYPYMTGIQIGFRKNF